MKLIKGNTITIFREEGYSDNNCIGCNHKHDTGYSYICQKTGEKLEGYDSMEEKLNNDNINFLPKHMGIGVGFKCPLPRVMGKYTHIDLSEKEMCAEDETEECTECGECGVQFAGKCCMNTTQDCTGCMEC